VTLYFAYGSNLNKEQMRHRCPAATAIGSIVLDDWLLVFRGVADIVQSPGDKVQGAVWKLTDACEQVLDRYEGVESQMYRKVYIPIEPYDFEGEMHDALLVYVMNSTGIMPPSKFYLRSIQEGYRDFKLPRGPLDQAVEASHDKKAPSHIERQRHARKGRPELASRPSEIAKAKAAKAAAPPPSKADQAKAARAAAKARPAGKGRPKAAPEPQGNLDLGLWGRAMAVYGD
jgi:hypothetical protein